MNIETIRQIIKDEFLILTESEIKAKQIEQELYNNFGEDNIDYIDIAYDILGILKQNLESIKANTSDGEENFDIEMGYNNTYYDKYIDTSRSQSADNIVSPVEVDEGMFVCFKCKCKRCTYYSIQKRSCDEPPTTYVRCTNRNCNNQWRFG